MIFMCSCCNQPTWGGGAWFPATPQGCGANYLHHTRYATVVWRGMAGNEQPFGQIDELIATSLCQVL
jgi:hypothetical protein